MADTGGHDLDKNLALAGTIKIEFHDFKRLASSNRDSGTRLHFLPSLGAVHAPASFFLRSR